MTAADKTNLPTRRYCRVRQAAAGPGLHAARHGGEEFAIVMSATDLTGALKLTEMLHGLGKAKCARRRGSQVVIAGITLSAGLAARVAGDDAQGRAWPRIFCKNCANDRRGDSPPDPWVPCTWAGPPPQRGPWLRSSRNQIRVVIRMTLMPAGAASLQIPHPCV